VAVGAYLTTVEPKLAEAHETPTDLLTAKWRTDGPGAGVRDQMVGSSVDRLIVSLKAASSSPEQGYGPLECDPSDR
jgi:hypothetical protein